MSEKNGSAPTKQAPACPHQPWTIIQEQHPLTGKVSARYVPCLCIGPACGAFSAPQGVHSAMCLAGSAAGFPLAAVPISKAPFLPKVVEGGRS